MDLLGHFGKARYYQKTAHCGWHRQDECRHAPAVLLAGMPPPLKYLSDVEFFMSLIEKTFNGIVAALKLISHIEPTSPATLKMERLRRQQLDETLDYTCVKVMIRSDTQERVRIVQKGQNFGAVVDFGDPKCGWSPAHLISGGIVYESPEIAEAEARAMLRWLADWKEEPVKPPPI